MEKIKCVKRVIENVSREWWKLRAHKTRLNCTLQYSPLVSKEEKRNFSCVHSRVLRGARDGGRCGRCGSGGRRRGDVLEQVGRFHSVYCDRLGGTIDVQGERLPSSTEDFEGALVGLLEGPPDAVDSEEDVGAAVKVLAGEDCGVFRRAWPHRPKTR